MQPRPREGSELVEATMHGLGRLQALVTSLSADFLNRRLGNGWTVAATLGHLAFWDHWVEARWNHFERTCSFHNLPDDITDLANEAAMAGWHALPPRETVRLCLDAAISVTHRIERLSPEHIAAAVETGRLALVNRTLHWYPHMDEIERAVR
jgi:Mycothiol maleylpyruvate isomerase N-terminal domain